jgi:hypothetical protein
MLQVATYFFLMDELAKKPEEANGSEGVWITQTDGIADCIGEALPLMVPSSFLSVYSMAFPQRVLTHAWEDF